MVVSDWYNVDVMKEIYFFDENSKQWWAPLTGGSTFFLILFFSCLPCLFLLLFSVIFIMITATDSFR
jgi:hypothetical protein